MAVCNVVASAIPSGYLMDMPSFWGVHWTDWMRTPVLILLQVALITILAHFAREAVNLRRRESPE